MFTSPHPVPLPLCFATWKPEIEKPVTAGPSPTSLSVTLGRTSNNWKRTNLTTLKRLLLCLPFAIAAFLNALMLLADGLQLPREQVGGYGFAFAAPWGWLLDLLFSSRTLGHGHLWQRELEGYAIFLWIPAALYSLCLWIVMRIFRMSASRLMSPNQTE